MGYSLRAHRVSGQLASAHNIDDRHNREKAAMSLTLKKWFCVFCLTGVLVLVCIEFLDRPLAYVMHAQIRQTELFEASVRWPEPFIPVAVIILLLAGLYNLSGRSVSYSARTIILCCVSVLWVSGLKTLLKFIFGRSWPETMHDHASFIRDGLYEFHLFGGGPGFESFPSGHMAVLSAVFILILLRHQRYQTACVAIIAASGAGLVAMNYHYLSDVIAGGFVGYTTSILLWAAVKRWQTSV